MPMQANDSQFAESETGSTTALSINDAYKLEDHQSRKRLMRISLILYIVLNPAFLGLDWLVYPNQLSQLFSIRMGFDLVFGTLLLITFTPIANRTRTLGVIAALIGGLSITSLITVTEGASSPYYAGLNLIIVVMSVLLPWTVIETTLVCLGTLLLYGLGCFYHSYTFEHSPFDWTGFNNNVFFILATSIICILASFYQSRRRFEEFRLNYELDRQNQQLAELDRLKSQFFANISHELRTPLTLILAPVQHLLEGRAQLPDRIAEPLGIVKGNALRLLKLVNDLLDVIRLQEGQVQLDLQPLELSAFTDGVVDSMTHLAETQGIELIREHPDTPLLVRADVSALEKITLNLIGNALKFTATGGTVRVSTNEHDQHAIIKVEDTGIGIASDQLPHVFDRFRQADGSSTRKFQGTGLGLALVKDLVSKLEGKIKVQSEVDVGTTMIVILPLLRGEDLDDVDAIQQPAISDLTEQGLEGFHRAAALQGGLAIDNPNEDEQLWSAHEEDELPLVLVVDDEPDMRRYLSEVLTEHYHVITARDGHQALQMANDHRPDLVILDLMLPGIDGLEICQQLKDQPNPFHQKIMLLTARADEESKLIALERGADDFLTKPFSTIEIRTRLRNLWETAKSQRDLAQTNEDLAQTLSNLKNTQSQLIHSEKLNALGTLSAGLLHEINNPLNYTHTAVQLAKMDSNVKASPILPEIFSDIDEGLGRIKDIVSDLRSFAYPGQQQRNELFTWVSAVNSATNFTAHGIKQFELDIHDIPEIKVIGSRNHIVQVLVNLLINAQKAIEEKKGNDSKHSGKITISGGIDHLKAFIRVCDNGIGMDEKTQSHIFEPFFTTREVGSGTGLGLSICHTIMQNHDGDICVSSKPDEGACFTLSLPLESTTNSKDKDS